MENRNDIDTNKIKTFRWLFYMSLFQLLMCLIFPIIIFPIHIILYIEILNALTVALLFGLYLMGVCVYGIYVDKSRIRLYIAVVIFVSLWTIWAIISWCFIEHMLYLT